LLPFGLLAAYDTERLILQGLEKISLGIRKDTGLMVLGHLGPWDYAASLSDGLSDVRVFDSRANPVFTGRLAYVRNDGQVGFSTLIGRILLDPDFGNQGGRVSERRIASMRRSRSGGSRLGSKGTPGPMTGVPWRAASFSWITL
jgi:hypothetical protein